MQINELKYAIYSAILNWRDLTEDKFAARGLYLIGSDVSSMDAARLWMSLTFARDIQLSELDGFIPPYPDLVEIDITETNTGIQAAVTDLDD